MGGLLGLFQAVIQLWGAKRVLVSGCPLGLPVVCGSFLEGAH